MAVYPGVISSQDLKRKTKNLDWEGRFMPQETKQTEGNNSVVDFKNIRLIKSPNHTSHRRKQVIFRACMVKSDSNDFGGWISELLIFQSSVNYLRN